VRSPSSLRQARPGNRWPIRELRHRMWVHPIIYQYQMGCRFRVQVIR